MKGLSFLRKHNSPLERIHEGQPSLRIRLIFQRSCAAICVRDSEQESKKLPIVKFSCPAIVVRNL